MITLKYRAPQGKQGSFTVDPETPSSLIPFIIEKELQISADTFVVLTGYPPKPFDQTKTVRELDLRTGMTLTVQAASSIGQAKQGHTDGKYVPPCDPKHYVVMRKVPGDDSCMFHAISYVLENKSRTGGFRLRSRIAEIVAAHPKKFTATYLGRPNLEYVSWILEPTSWGGAIELDILSFLFSTEIVAVDRESKRMHRFGETENYATRVFVAYSGKHYDALGLNASQTGGESDDQVLFNSRDEEAMKKISLMLNFDK
eukprot:PhF_6_TR11537/c0_g1_i1/m.18519/K13719/OTU1, YOD1; ubiquitin thioesterase OTU1